MNVIIVEGFNHIESAAKKYPKDCILYLAINSLYMVAAQEEIGREMTKKFSASSVYSRLLGRWLITTGKPDEESAIQLLKDKGYLDSTSQIIYLRLEKDKR